MVNLSLKAEPNKLHIQLFRYTIVGALAYAIDFTSLIFLTEVVQLHYLVSATIAFILGLAINYLLSTRWVFGKRSLNSKRLEFIIFASIGIVGLVINDFFIWFMTEKLMVYYIYSKILSTIFVYLWNFFARRQILFR